MRFFRRKYARLDEPFPEDWRAIIVRNVAHWAYLDDDEREHLEDAVVWLVVDKRWEAARGFALDDEIRVTIAAQAGLLLLGFDDDGVDHYANVKTIIVHPTTMTMSGERAGPVPGTVVDGPLDVLGLAQYDGPVLIAWDQARRNARHPSRGHNVVYHEFAHKLDMLDGVIDGTPPMSSDEAAQRFAEVCQREFERLQQTYDNLFDSYAATDPAEFFAVATEVFFDMPIEFEEQKPELYAVLRAFYQQDPATRVRRYSSQRK
jgi:Mlc titration factor MtfA (ptsG expression regulator)